MKKGLYYPLLLLLCMYCGASQAKAACATGETEIVVQITPDNYPNETTWDIRSANNSILATGNASGGTFCVPANTCLSFTIYDTYGDGICCTYGNGSYRVYADGVQIASGGNFGNQERTDFNCPPGYSCNMAIPVNTGTFTAAQANSWYSFTPNASGMYQITTCEPGNTCDTKIWVYETCTNLNWNNTNQGTLYYDDNSGGCGNLARVSAALQAGITYIIRIGDAGGSCGSGAIDWSISYSGPITGCMDPESCNYNPMATVSDGNCLFYPDPNCPDGPDLIILQSQIENSLHATYINSTNCWVEENCLTGYGQRRILRFTTWIRNIGTLDYFIGNPGNNPDQFSFQNCHGHAHYEGYAEYSLYKITGERIPIGYKNGFCVMDLECGGGGQAQYGCNNMGISAGCGDVYDAGLDCQWLDITDVDPGEYVLAVKINWNQSPDALGRYETRYDNNWAQVCIRIFEDGAGVKQFAFSDDCPDYVDCNGTPFGNEEADCEGNCGGSRKYGDLNTDATLDATDAQLYVQRILSQNLSPSSCNDLNNDGKITVWDAALVNHCVLRGSSFNNACRFPYSIYNTLQTVSLRVDTLNLTDHYMDVWIKNPYSLVNAFEFNVSGLQILDVVSLYNDPSFPVLPVFIPGQQKIVGISHLDSALNRNPESIPFCRIYYSSLTDTEVCLSEIVHIVNGSYEAVQTEIENGCRTVSPVSVKEVENAGHLTIWPNPGNGIFHVAIRTPQPADGAIEVLNTLGEQVMMIPTSAHTEVLLDLSSQTPGIYLVRYRDPQRVITQRIVLSR